jgi:hypothetical protein
MASLQAGGQLAAVLPVSSDGLLDPPRSTPLVDSGVFSASARDLGGPVADWPRHMILLLHGARIPSFVSFPSATGTNFILF